MKNANEFLLAVYDFENALSSGVRELSLENCQGFTVLAQTNVANTKAVTLSLYGKMPAWELLDVTTLQALNGNTDDLSDYVAPHEWVLIQTDTLAAGQLGPNNPGWAITDSGIGYKALKVIASVASADTGVFLSITASTLMNK